MRINNLAGVACLFALTSAVSAQKAQPKLPSPQTQINQMALGYPPAIYQMNDVSKSMNLTPQQINNLNRVTEQTQAQYRDQYNRLSTLNEADRTTRLQELHRQYYGDWNKSARDFLNDNQWQRYQQLNHQHGGFNAFYDPNVQKQLNLTTDQIKNLGDQRTWSDQQWQEINRLGATDPAKGNELYRDYWKERQRRLNKYLTPEQQKGWREMTGEPYDFQPTFAPSR